MKIEEIKKTIATIKRWGDEEDSVIYAHADFFIVFQITSAGIQYDLFKKDLYIETFKKHVDLINRINQLEFNK